ncbi:short-chain fatty acyl-CoA regulator family protein [Sphingomonas sp. BAUL-RG-20F-R05-02]|uniref:helix-turn-helix domain-containing protein n=1 Tax=Sphingomonas sp. BAUL-RG-20F-R05-02 TaxID=2914830 RepID=UPI001F5AA60A|nr:XRE family transcriptional regulator [Sphingomonas sp. BAUL-RG-20F-R05-02]
MLKDRKLYLGPKLRVLRRELGISQTQMAQELGISPSYLNHLERNQRPLSAQMLLRFADTYDIDVREFVASASREATSDLRELLSDPLVRDIGIPRDEVNDLAENYPSVVEAMNRIYHALLDLRRLPDAIDRLNGAINTGRALDWLRDYVQQSHNHFPEIEAAAEQLAVDLPEDPAERFVSLRHRLDRDHRVSVRVSSEQVMGGALRFYDLHRRRLLISERLPASGRLFAVAYQVAMLALDAPIDGLLARAAPPTEATSIFKTSLTNYAAAAILMPYERFFASATATRHDLALLESRFGTSYEQIAHRLTTLSRSGARGLPFFMLKVDLAGTVSKRYADDGIPLARFGGACPRWNVYRAFQSPGRTLAEIVEMPDGARYVTMCRALPGVEYRPGARSAQAVVIGCDVKHAGHVAAADELSADRANPIGPACHTCERVGCPDRALPPVTRSLTVTPYQKMATPYPFKQV